MVICLERAADLHMPSRCHCHSLSLASVKSRLVLPFWYRPTQVVVEKGPLNGCVLLTYKNTHHYTGNFPAGFASNQTSFSCFGLAQERECGTACCYNSGLSSRSSQILQAVQTCKKTNLPQYMADLSTPEGSKVEMTSTAGYIPRWYTHPNMVTHPSTNCDRRRVTSFMWQMTLPLCQTITSCQHWQQGWMSQGFVPLKACCAGTFSTDFVTNLLPVYRRKNFENQSAVRNVKGKKWATDTDHHARFLFKKPTLNKCADHISVSYSGHARQDRQTPDGRLYTLSWKQVK